MSWLSSWGGPWLGSWFGSDETNPASVNYWTPDNTFTFNHDAVFGNVTTPLWSRSTSPRETLIIFEPRPTLFVHKNGATLETVLLFETDPTLLIYRKRTK